MSGRSLHHIFLTMTTVIVFLLCLLVLNNNNNNNNKSNNSGFVSASVTYCQNRLHGIAQYGKCYIKASFNSEASTPDVMADGTLQVESDGELTLVNKNYYRPWAEYAFVNGAWRWRNGQPGMLCLTQKKLIVIVIRPRLGDICLIAVFSFFCRSFFLCEH